VDVIRRNRFEVMICDWVHAALDALVPAAD
jgi:hypothetical protein